MLVITLSNRFLKRVGYAVGLLVVLGVGVFLGTRAKDIFYQTDFIITDDLAGNIFPSSILAVATTDVIVVPPSDKAPYVGHPKSDIAIRIKSPSENARITVTMEETPFFRTSISEFILPLKDTTYVVYPDILWNFDALRNNLQAEPVNVTVQVQVKGQEPCRQVKTFSVRSINECLLGYIDHNNKVRRTDMLFAAYVNENHPLIDGILREALNTRIVNRFAGYQVSQAEGVDRQVYALWHVLQQRKFKYSSTSYTSLSSNVVFSQRVRTFEDAFRSSQINCVDGSIVFASLLRAINIDPILVRVPGHMYIGYYTDSRHSDVDFLETTMIGDINLDDFFPEENLDSVVVGKSQKEMSRIAFEKSKVYARKNYEKHRKQLEGGTVGYTFLEISKSLRRKIQPIGK